MHWTMCLSIILRKNELNEITSALQRNNNDNALALELHDVKFAFEMCNMNWNRKHYPFLGCYCQRGDNFRKATIAE